MAIFEPSLDLQAIIRARLLASADLMALVPADNVVDVTGRPERVPAVIIGESQSVFDRFKSTAHLTIHCWFQEPGLVTAKAAASAIIQALHVDAQMEGVLVTANFTVHDMRVTDTRYLRDPHGSYSHAVITVTAIVKGY